MALTMPPRPQLSRISSKVPEQVDYLQKHVVRIAVGTPNRLFKLVEEGR